jgi:hypothetical protein
MLVLASMVFAVTFGAMGDEEDEPDGPHGRPELSEQLPSGR